MNGKRDNFLFSLCTQCHKTQKHLTASLANNIVKNRNKTKLKIDIGKFKWNFSFSLVVYFCDSLTLSLWFILFHFWRECVAWRIWFFSILFYTYTSPEAVLFVESRTVGSFNGWRWESFVSMTPHSVFWSSLSCSSSSLLALLLSSHFVPNNLFELPKAGCVIAYFGATETVS